MIQGSKKKILLAENDEFLASLLKGRLEGREFLVEIAKTAKKR